MKKYYILLLAIITVACTDVRFKEPMPLKGEQLTLMPDDLVDFIKSMDPEKFEKIPDIDKDLEMRKVPDDMVLKKWKGAYFLNYKVDSLWVILLLKQQKEGKDFLTYQLMGKNKETVAMLKEITDVKEHYSETGKLEYIELNPTQKEFKKIYKSNLFEYIQLFD